MLSPPTTAAVMADVGSASSVNSGTAMHGSAPVDGSASVNPSATVVTARAWRVRIIAAVGVRAVGAAAIDDSPAADRRSTVYGHAKMYRASAMNCAAAVPASARREYDNIILAERWHGGEITDRCRAGSGPDSGRKPEHHRHHAAYT